MAAYMNSDRWLSRRQIENNAFLFCLCYKRNGKRCSYATMELWMHLGGLLSTKEARVALGYRLVWLLRFFRSELVNICRKALSSSVGLRKVWRHAHLVVYIYVMCAFTSLRSSSPLWFVWWYDVCFKVLSCFFDLPSIDSPPEDATVSIWKGCFDVSPFYARISASWRSFQQMLLNNIPWKALDRMTFMRNYTNTKIKLKCTAAPFHNFFKRLTFSKYWRE